VVVATKAEEGSSQGLSSFAAARACEAGQINSHAGRDERNDVSDRVLRSR